MIPPPLHRLTRYFLFWLFLVWALDYLLKSLFPFTRYLLDPLLLVLAYLGLRGGSHRFLWLQGMGLGLLKDLSTGAMLGGWSCAFGLTGALLAMGKHLMEAEDPLVAGVWVALLTLAANLLYGLLSVLADPFARWSHGPWIWLPVSMAAQALAAGLLFPRLPGPAGGRFQGA